MFRVRDLVVVGARSSSTRRGRCRSRAASSASRPSACCRPGRRPPSATSSPAASLTTSLLPSALIALGERAGDLGDGRGDGGLVGRGRRVELGMAERPGPGPAAGVTASQRDGRSQGAESSHAASWDASLQTNPELTVQIECLDRRAARTGPAPATSVHVRSPSGARSASSGWPSPSSSGRSSWPSTRRRSRGRSCSFRCGARWSASSRRAAGSAPGFAFAGIRSVAGSDATEAVARRADLATDRAAARVMVAYCGAIALA